ncbi:coniferyl alcohol acyltransferase-like [Rutidosis leptorrhynchoides]|uniref:coniferyl alcohol acyltransferase-like n=1 Tax=Rutidosis leptorrhynchoides TaxID=125765 RepID=UPI003A9A0B21
MDVNTMIDVLKTSLSQALGLFYTLAGEIVRNASGEPEVHCNNKGVEFIEAESDVDLRDLNFYNPDENVGGKLMPKKRHGVLVVQATALRCGGLVLACMFDHRVLDGYSINLFTSSWVNMALSKPLFLVPNVLRSNLNVRHPRVYTPSVANMYVPLPIYESLQNVPKNDQYQHSLTNRIYYMEGDQIKRLQSLASENGTQISKIEAVTSFLWKITGSLLEDSGHFGYKCNVVVPVNGRRWLEGVEKQKLMAARSGNVFSMPFRGMQAKVTTC